MFRDFDTTHQVFTHLSIVLKYIIYTEIRGKFDPSRTKLEEKRTFLKQSRANN